MEEEKPIEYNGATDLFGETIERDALLRDKFLEPPFTILDGRAGSWQNRKRMWLAKGIKSETSREEVVVINNSFGEKYGRGMGMKNEVSVFDPALAELMYRWFCPPGGAILDPFAGGSVRGVVAGYLGYQYTGLELRPEQVEANRAQRNEIIPTRAVMWMEGDSDMTLDRMQEGYEFDMLFTCPPYMDLEVYSDNPNDLSNMSDELFTEKYTRIITKACALLRDNSFAVIVIGDVRDKGGFYKDFPGITKQAFKAAGMRLYNEAMLLQPLGTAMLRANNIFGTNKKLVKVHENVLVFYKGDPKEVRRRFAQED